MHSLLTFAFTIIGFVVLVATFFGIARLVAQRRSRKSQSATSKVASQEAGDPSEEIKEEVSPATAMIHGANYGLVLGILACVLFKILARLMLTLSAAGCGYSLRALWQGLSRYRIVVYGH